MDPNANSRIAALCADLTNYERDRPDRVRFDLAAMEALLGRPGAAALPRWLIQVGGSKGKGTTARYIAALAASTGCVAGVYSSPHAESVLERVSVDGAPVDEATLTVALRGVLDYARDAELTISFYEAMTAAALECFALRGVELGVLEVGLGGRLDATTAVPVQSSVLTTVELEHTEILGDTIEAIAGEKAPILRAGRPGVTAVEGIALDVAQRHADAVGCALQVLRADFDYEERSDAGRVIVDVSAIEAGLGTGDSCQIEVRDAPLFEARAAALAWVALRSLGDFAMPPRQLAIARPAAPCCFESFGAHGVVLDGAHTPDSVAFVCSEIERRFGATPIALLFGCARGKHWRAMLERLAPACALILVSEVEGTACEDPDEILAWLHDQDLSKNATVVAPIDGLEDGVARLMAFDRGPRLVTGSFYLAGAARGALRDAEDSSPSS